MSTSLFRLLIVVTLLSLTALATCSKSDGGDDDDDDSAVTTNDDDSVDDDDTVDDDDDDDSTVDDDDDTVIEYWSPSMTLGSEIQEHPRGWITMKGVIHLHSIYSHDACDGEGFLDEAGTEPNEPCRQQMRDALCDTDQDFALLTDHPANMRDYPFEDLFVRNPEDGWFMEGDAKLASVIHCPTRDVYLSVGWESDLMPLMLTDHLAPQGEERNALYGGEGPDTVAAIRANGALVGIPHSESRTPEQLRAIGPDAMEIYQLHANIDPDIRVEYLGLDAMGFLTDAFPFLLLEGENLPHPDLVFLSFFSENTPSMATWEALMNESHITGTAACDAHRNALPNLMSDGERVDSYRRMMRWFGNYLWTDSRDPIALREALQVGRNIMVFEIMGVPVGFDFYAQTGAGTADMGSQVALGDHIIVTPPTVALLDPALTPPDIKLVLIHVAMDGTRTTVLESAEAIDYVIDAEGAYRVEAHIVPRHLQPWLGGEDHLIRDYVWIYTNPIYAR